MVCCLSFGQTKTYTVREGDTISGIAARCSVRQADLLKANSIKSTQRLKIGQKLIVPGSRPTKVSGGYAVKPGDNDWTIAKRFHLTEHQLHLLNPGVNWQHLKLGLRLRVTSGGAVVKRAATPHPVATKHPAVKKPASATYTVRKGDNDWVIASHIGVTPRSLRLLNPGTNWDRLQIGTKLRIPGRAALAARTPAIRSRYAKIARDAVIIRRKPSTSSEKVTVVEAGLPVTVLDRTSGWYKLKFPKGTVGWVRGDMLKAAPRPVVAHRSHRARSYEQPAPRRVAKRHSGSKKRSGTRVAVNAPSDASPLLKNAYRRMGQRYTYGRNDCSGFVMSVYRTQGVALPHSSRSQSRLGRRVSKGELQPGDLVFFKTNRGTRINHVGIYVGNGRFIHASSGGGKVQTNSLSDGYYNKRFAGGRRLGSKSKKK